MTDSTPEEIAADTKARGLSLPQTVETYILRSGVSGKGPKAYDWSDKPHRLVYDACRLADFQNAEIERLKSENEALLEELEKYRHGYQGSCYACEPVGMLNQALQEKIDLMEKGND